MPKWAESGAESGVVQPLSAAPAPDEAPAPALHRLLPILTGPAKVVHQDLLTKLMTYQLALMQQLSGW